MALFSKFLAASAGILNPFIGLNKQLDIGRCAWNFALTVATYIWRHIGLVYTLLITREKTMCGPSTMHV